MRLSASQTIFGGDVSLAPPARSVGKRILDVAVSAPGLVALAPLFLLVALAIKLTSPGPVFYRQQRVGLLGRPFYVWKFRTMVVDADKIGPPLTSGSDDPRITRIGRILRQSSLDELPQLWNVLKGEMSLVGPRPEIPDIVSEYSATEARSLSARPGITGWAQINGRDDLPIPEKLALDRFYIDHWSLWFDIVILFRTIAVVTFDSRGRN